MKLSFRPLLLGLSLCLLQAASAELPSNWPLPTLPPGANPATFATPRNDWMVQFAEILQGVKKQKIDLAFEGDSITAGWRGGGHDVFTSRYSALNAYSFGIGGDRTEHVLWRLQQGELDGLSPKLIVLMIGTNNISAGNTPQQVAEGIAAIVKDMRTRCPSSHILLLAIFPRGPVASYPLRAKITETNKLIQPLADDKNVTYLDIGQKFLAPDGTLSPDIMPDFLHPNAKGYVIWADAIQDIVNQYLKGS